MIEVKRFAGILNLDDQPQDVLPIHHIHAKNIRFYGGQNGLTAQNIRGNFLVNNSNLPAGDNECIGSFYDGLRQRIIWANWNSNGWNGWYQYDLNTNLVAPLLISFVNSTTDILGFSRNFPISSIVMLYTTESDGDVLLWTSRNMRPMKLNIKDALANIYGSSWLENYLTVSRPVAPAPPTYLYKDDATVNINNLRKKLFQFRYRPVYKDFTRGTWSAWSKLFSPLNPDSIGTDIDQQKNNRLDIIINTLGGDCITIEVAARNTIVGSNIYSDPFLITTINKADLGLIDNQLYTYQFYNNESYTNIDIQESDLLWSKVPKLANTLELLNGNVIIYGGLTEGYDFDETLDVDITLSMVPYSAAGGSVLITKTYENNVDAGGGNWSYTAIFDVTGLPATGDVYTIYYSTSNFLPSFFSYTVAPGDTLDDIVDGLVAAFMALTQVPPGQYEAVRISGDLVIRSLPPGGASFHVSFSSVTYAYAGGSSNPVDGVTNSIYKHRSRYAMGLVYFDEFDETDGVHIDSTMLFETGELTTTGDTETQIPKISIEINHQPPIWAKKYAFVRTGNKSLSNLLSTVSCGTRKDSAPISYAYIEITNQQNNTSNYPIYDFLEGDRVRIIGKFSATPTILAYDFPIVNIVTNPLISGVTATGIFLKIPYDAVLVNFGTAGNDNYLIEIYTPAPSTSSELSSYYEFGETYEVLNPGLSNRAHGGQLQSQIVGTQPATFEFLRGDYYIKARAIPFEADLSDVIDVFIIDQSVSDKYPSRVTGNGRAYVVDEFAIETYFPTAVRWGLDYQQNTNVNRTNVFFPQNLDEVDRAKGDIQRFKSRDRILRVFQDRAVGQYGVYSRFIQNNSGQSELVTTDEIITANNIQYYKGEYGLCGYQTNLASGKISDYFIDVVTGREIRLSGDGMTDIGLLYKGQFYLSNLVTPYNKSLIRSNGSIAKIIKFWDSFENQCHTLLQGGTGTSTVTQDQNYSFNEPRNAFCSFYDFHPEWAMCANDIVFSWKNGGLYKHDGNNYNCQFYGVNYGCHVTFVFNQNLLEKKSWQSITEIASDTWDTPEIYTNTMSYGNQRQQTNLVPAEFVKLEGNPSASIKRDANSRGGKVNGDSVKGNYCVIKFQKQNAQYQITLSEISLSFADSALTVK